ncbi:rhodanese-like domain-containing protein [Frankia tisae]|uniref:rhodanese-like domain-containing protein n=1 Tax=Frankia tisae TaxID=2950104 RepID=UPI0021C15112|nr:rhodanese-like domain-containing protein [Frankia tisae]
MGPATGPAVGPAVGVVAPRELHARLRARLDLVVVDVGTRDEFAAGHLSVATHLPLDHLEPRLPLLAPRLTVPLVIVGARAETVARAVSRVAALGYPDVSVLDGGLAGWRAAGLELFTGFNTVSRALGEVALRRLGTPSVSAAELRVGLGAGEDVVLLDTRMAEEFAYTAIPTALNAPGVELVRRAYAALRSPRTRVVVTCAGRTRGIIGAQTLIDAGFPNPVAVLDGGLSAWSLAGYPTVTGSTARSAVSEPAQEARAGAAARALAARAGVAEISAAELRGFVAAAAGRTLYLFDVRTQAEFVAGHLPGSRWAPGGQLLQATDEYLGSRGARVVLVDDGCGTRGFTTGVWLARMGLPDVAVHLLGSDGLGSDLLGSDGLVRGPETVALPEAPTVSVPALRDLLDDGAAVVVDVEPPAAAGWLVARPYIPGSLVTTRSALAARPALAPADGALVVVTSGDGTLARWATADLRAAGWGRAAALDGGTRAWHEAGQPTATDSAQQPLDPRQALPLPPTRQQRARLHDDYVAWCAALEEQLHRDGIVSFPVGPLTQADAGARKLGKGVA